MASKYRPLVTITFRHEYYRDGIMRGITLHPLGDSGKRMSNYRLLAKQDTSGLRLLQECRNEDEPSIAVEKDFTLAFGLRCNDTDFQARTGVEFFTSNQQKLAIDLRTEDETPELRLLPLIFDGFSFTPEETGTMTLSSGSGVVSEQNVKDINSPQVFNMSEHQEDVYRLEMNGVVKKEFILLHGDSAFEGVIFVRVSREIVNKTIAFPARQIHLQYTIVQKYNTYQQLSLVDESDSIVFEKAERPDLPNAVSFVSAAPVRLQQHHLYRLQVKDQERVVKKNIPFVNLKNIGKCLINVHNYCLENYVTI